MNHKVLTERLATEIPFPWPVPRQEKADST